MLQLVPLSTCPPQPWRNGGGTTRELLRWPAAAPGEDGRADEAWLVRVSVAEIARDGPFSPYPGIDRWFAVLAGAGVRLELPEGEAPRRPGDDALAFAGEAAPGCTLIDGTTSDLNLMVRRGASPAAGPAAAATRGPASASMRLARPGSAQRGRRPWRALYAHEPGRLLADEDWHDLPAGTLAWSDANRVDTWELAHDAGLAFWMSFEAGSP